MICPKILVFANNLDTKIISNDPQFLTNLIILVDLDFLPIIFRIFIPLNVRKNISRKQELDIEKTYSTSQFVAKLRRFADALETGERFRIQVAGKRITVPTNALFNIEHERENEMEEIEFQIKRGFNRT